jgi:hypothetical protein
MGRYGPRDRYLASELQESVMRIAEQAGDFVDAMVIRGRSRTRGEMVSLNMVKERLGKDIELEPAYRGASFSHPDDAYRELERSVDDIREDGLIETAVRAQRMRG